MSETSTTVQQIMIQLLIGSAIIVVSILIQSLFVSIATRVLSRTGARLISPHAHVIAVASVTIWMLIAISIVVWLWAVVFLALGAFTELEPSLYFSIVSFTTLGFGDSLLPVQWRLLSGLVATNGLVLFGLSTAFLVELVIQIRDAMAKNS